MSSLFFISDTIRADLKSPESPLTARLQAVGTRDESAKVYTLGAFVQLDA